MKFIIAFLLPALLAGSLVHGQDRQGQDHRFDPPWNQPPVSKVPFTVPGIDNVPDLFGDINDPQLVIFFAGNQYMVMDSLIAAFRGEFPAYKRIFAETLPPGILERQIEAGSVTIGNMRITLKPDIFTDGRGSIVRKMAWFTDTTTYAWNNLAIMVRKGNPLKIGGWKDLGRPEVRVSMPNPAWEGIGERIEAAYVKGGGEALRTAIMVTKVKDSSTFLTTIHHRQTPMRVLYGESDAGPVWSSEVLYHMMIGHPIELVKVPDAENIRVGYAAGLLKDAPHAEAARDFMRFLKSDAARRIYRYYGFEVRR
jgi:hypothetical protein